MNTFQLKNRLERILHGLTVLWLLSGYGLITIVDGQPSDVHDGDSEHHDDEHDDEHDDDGPIRLSTEDLKDFGILISEADSGTIREELRLPGEIRMNEHAIAHVGPRFEGVVTAVHKRLGDNIQAGEILAEMETNDTLRPFNLSAPINGKIVDFHLTLGESLSAGDYAYVIADTSTVWADLKVYQRDLPKIRPGQGVRISAGHEYPVAKGEISYLGPVVDEKTRTGLARIVLKNPHDIYRPGLFIIGNVFLTEEKHQVVIPLSALHVLNDKTVVYIKRNDGDGFEPREVIVGHRDSHNAEIRRGLTPGVHYVSEGGFFLKADSQKEEFGDGHAH